MEAAMTDVDEDAAYCMIKWPGGSHPASPQSTARREQSAEHQARGIASAGDLAAKAAVQGEAGTGKEDVKSSSDGDDGAAVEDDDGSGEWEQDEGEEVEEELATPAAPRQPLPGTAGMSWPARTSSLLLLITLGTLLFTGGRHYDRYLHQRQLFPASGSPAVSGSPLLSVERGAVAAAAAHLSGALATLEAAAATGAAALLLERGDARRVATERDAAVAAAAAATATAAKLRSASPLHLVATVGPWQAVQAVMEWVDRRLAKPGAGLEEQLAARVSDVGRLQAALQRCWADLAAALPSPRRVLPLSLGLEANGDKMVVLVPRNTAYPIRKERLFTGNTTNVSMRVFQGEGPLTPVNHLLGSFVLTNVPPTSSGVSELKVVFDIDADGTMTVTAQDKASGRQHSITVTAGEVLGTRGDAQQRVAEAVRLAAGGGDAASEAVKAKDAERRMIFSYVQDMRVAAGAAGAAEMLGPGGVVAVDAALSSAVSWLRDNPLAEVDEIRKRRTEVFAVVHPLMQGTLQAPSK